jgi:PAS domain S-box-containing protein
MRTASNRLSRTQPYSGSRSTLLVASVTVASSYLLPRLVGALISNPKTVWPLWPGCAILVTGLLLVRVNLWPVVIPASFAGFAIADLQAGVPLSSIGRFIPGNTVEVLISAIGLKYCFGGVPRLNGVKALAKYSLFAVILGPFAGAFFSAHGIARDYWTGWKIVFLSEVLAFITVTPALLSWVSEGRELLRRSRAYQVEGATLIAGLVFVSYIVFTLPEDSRSPALFYSLVPFLLWSALRFGWLGVSTSLIAVTFLSIWGAVYGRGPFSNMVPLTDPLPLQMFLVFASVPFMLLAALSEEHEEAAHVVRESEARLRLAQWAAHIGTFDLNLRTGVDIWQPETEALFGLPRGGFGGTLSAFEDLIHPDDRERIRELTQEMIRTGQDTESEWRVIWPDGSVHWIASRGRVLMDESGEPARMIGVNMDVTERREAEEALRKSEERFRLAAVAGRMFAYEWDAASDVIIRSGDFSQILGTGEATETTGQQVLDSTHPDDRQRVDAAVGALSPENPHLRVSYRMWRRDGSFLWVERTSRAHFDKQGRMVRIVGMLADVTERKQAEIALAEMTRKLIEAQEQERARLGRELHDDINQRLAMLSMEAEQLLENPSEIKSRVKQFREEIVELSDDVQALSHDLHSSKLEYLGALGGMKSWCKEFAERYKLEIKFRADVSTPIPQDLGVSLFRVLQEALQNAIKHSGSIRFEVQLREESGQIHLLVTDSGKGFDVEAALRGKGLGLTSMRERVRLVNGTMSIESKPMGGTTIHVRVPLGPAKLSERAAG